MVVGLNNYYLGRRSIDNCCLHKNLSWASIVLVNPWYSHASYNTNQTLRWVRINSNGTITFIIIFISFYILPYNIIYRNEIFCFNIRMAWAVRAKNAWWMVTRNRNLRRREVVKKAIHCHIKSNRSWKSTAIFGQKNTWYSYSCFSID